MTSNLLSPFFFRIPDSDAMLDGAFSVCKHDAWIGSDTQDDASLFTCLSQPQYINVTTAWGIHP